MNYAESAEFVDYYKRYYKVKNPSVLCRVVQEEFSYIPLELMIKALRWWTNRPKGMFEPTVLELRDALWRMKIVAIARLFDSDQNEKWNKEHIGQTFFSDNELINEEIEDKWTTFTDEDRKPTLPEEEKVKLTKIISTLEIGLRGFNKQYE